MKKVIKLQSGLYSIVLLFGLNQVSFASADSSSDTCIDGESENVSNFIESHFSTFVDEYNMSSENNWQATSIEDRKSVIDIDTEEEYIYLDFNEDNGYAIVGNDYNLVDFSTTGDLSYTKEVDTLYWSSYDGFVYIEEEEYLRYNANYLTEDELNDYAFKYDGKVESYENWSDVIKDIPVYLTSRYGGDWYIDNKNSKTLTNYVDVYQKDNAIYDGSEGNCTLSAYFGIFQYLRDNKNFKNLPTGKVKVNVSDDTFGKGHKAENDEVDAIYAKIRESAMDYNYTTESDTWTSINMARWGNEALASMGYSSRWFRHYIYMCLTWTFRSQVVKNINDGYPVMWNQARGNYSNHSMVVKGYKTYKKDHRFWFIKWSESKHFIMMNDNWKETPETTYIDFDGYSNDLINEGFGTFVVVKDYLW